MLPAFFFLILILATRNICLGKCYASQENKRLECSNLHDFPRGTESIEVLQATNNTFIKIASNLFREKQFGSLKAAVLRYNNIRVVEKGAFNSSLILLDLTGNHLEELQFESASLKILILAQNRLKNIHMKTIGPNLLFLDVSNNNLTQIDLKNLHRLKYLDISNNPLDFSQTFLQSDSLAVLRISFNGMQRISPEFFTGLPNLQVLDLSGDLKLWPAHLLHPLSNLRILYIGKLLINEEPFVPASVEKIVQSEMDVTSSAFVSKILKNLDEFNESTQDFKFLQYLEDDINDYYNEPIYHSSWFDYVRKGLLFSVLVYLSLMYTLCLSQVAKSLIYKPYQRLYVDEI